MTSRERLLTTLKHKVPDRVPWSALVNNYFLESQGNKYSKMNSVSFLKEMRADLFDWVGLEAKSKNVVVKTYIDGEYYKTDDDGNWLTEFYDYLVDIDYYRNSRGRIVERKFLTPLGELTAEFTYTPVSHTVFISDFPIKSLQDYKIFAYMIESLEYQDLGKSFQEKENEIGEEGVTVAFLHSTPAYELIQCFMGLERFHYFFYDYKKETLRLMDTMFNKFCECYKLYSKTTVPVILVPEDASTTIYSPDFFDRYLKPVLKEYCRIIKESGKVAVIHACGHLKGLIKSLRETGADCIESVSPPPTGNIAIQEFRKALPNFCVMGGIPANAFLLELEQFREYVKRLVIENKEGANFILSSGDSVPSDAKIENIKVIPDLIEKYGKY